MKSVCRDKDILNNMKNLKEGLCICRKIVGLRYQCCIQKSHKDIFDTMFHWISDVLHYHPFKYSHFVCVWFSTWIGSSLSAKLRSTKCHLLPWVPVLIHITVRSPLACLMLNLREPLTATETLDYSFCLQIFHVCICCNINIWLCFGLFT